LLTWNPVRLRPMNRHSIHPRLRRSRVRSAARMDVPLPIMHAHVGHRGHPYVTSFSRPRKAPSIRQAPIAPPHSLVHTAIYAGMSRTTSVNLPELIS
jgi:hypothetical protein